MSQPFTLVCFAVKEEAKRFKELVRLQPGIQCLLTGIGARNAERTLRAALAKEKPELVISAGFAGGLEPKLVSGTVVFDTDGWPALQTALLAAGARPARFHCAEKVATTAAEKRKLREDTGAEVVEMESQIIGSMCRQEHVPCATVRVVLDTAAEDLPLDFNQLMTPDRALDNRKLALAILKAPGKISALLRLQKQSGAAAEKLAAVLVRLCPGLEGPSSPPAD
jgi:adenosylhomocysteine nucleosidase